MTLRTALIITLSLLVVYLIARRIKRNALRSGVPAISHAELLSLEVAYHPSRLHVVLKIPESQSIRTILLDEQHMTRFTWPETRLDKGMHALERTLPPLADGTYYLEVATTTQRTVRQFRLQ